MAATKKPAPRKAAPPVRKPAPAKAKPPEPQESVEEYGDAAEQDSIVEYSEDVSQAEAPPPLPIGDYSAEITQALVVPNKDGSGKRHYVVAFRIEADQYPADYNEGDPDGTTLRVQYLSAEDNQAKRVRLRRFCERAGIPVPTNRCDQAFRDENWVGQKVRVRVKHETYEGETRAAVEDVQAIS